MKKVILIIVIFFSFYQAYGSGTKPSAIWIDSVYVHSGTLIVQYNVVKPLDQVRLYVQKDDDMQTAKGVPSILAGNTGKHIQTIPIDLIVGQPTGVNVILSGSFVNKNDSLEYSSNNYRRIIVKREKDNGTLHYRMQYTEEEQLFLERQKKSLFLINSEGKPMDGYGAVIQPDQNGVYQNYQDARFIDPLSIYNNDPFDVNYQSEDQDNIQPTRATYHFKISGNVNVYGSALFDAPMPEARVFLFFVNSNNHSSLYHPVPFTSALVKGTHWALTDQSGNYSFDFNVTTTNLTNYNQIFLCVARHNDHVLLNIGADGESFYYSNPHSTGFSFDVLIFLRNYSTAYTAFNPSTTNLTLTGKNITVGNTIMGGGLGMFSYAGRLANQLGYNPPLIDVFQTSLAANVGGQFVPSSVKINIANTMTLTPGNVFVTPAHEYGHYLNYRLWNSSLTEWNKGDLQTYESFAMFYSYAVRHFAYKNWYGFHNNGTGFLVNSPWDNLDIAPFDAIPRFRNNFSYPDNVHPNYARLACYMWNLYDGNSNYTFVQNGSIAYVGNYNTLTDNDDIVMPTRVIQSFAAIRKITDLPNNFKTRSPVLSVLEQSSVDAIYNRMITDNSWNIMRSGNFESKSMILNGNSLTVNITYQPFDFSFSNSINTRNSPTSFQVSRQRFKNAPWLTIATIPYIVGTTSYSLPSYSVTNSTNYNYKLSVVNSGGEFAYPFILTYNSNNAPTFSFTGNVPYSVNVNQTYTSGFSVSSISGLQSDVGTEYLFMWYANTDNGWRYLGGNRYPDTSPSNIYFDSYTNYKSTYGGSGYVDVKIIGDNYFYFKKIKFHINLLIFR